MGKPRTRCCIVNVGVLREHEGKSACLRGLETVAGDRGAGSFDDLLPGGARQDPLRALEVLRELGPRGWRVEAVWRAYPRIPELGIVEAGRPGAFDEADEAVLALRRRLIAVATEDQYFGARGASRRSGAECQCHLGLEGCDAILLGRGHLGIG